MSIHISEKTKDIAKKVGLGVVTAGGLLLAPEVFAAGATVLTDSSLANIMDTANDKVADLDTKVVAYYKPFILSAALVGGARFIYLKVYG